MLVQVVIRLVQRLGRYEVSSAHLGLYYSADEIRIGVRVGVDIFYNNIVHLAEGDLLHHIVTLSVVGNGVDLGEHNLYGLPNLLPPRLSLIIMSMEVVIWPPQDQQRTAP